MITIGRTAVDVAATNAAPDVDLSAAFGSCVWGKWVVLGGGAVGQNREVRQFDKRDVHANMAHPQRFKSGGDTYFSAVQSFLTYVFGRILR